MQKLENYRPAHIEFTVSPDETPVPENLGKFDNSDDAVLFMQKNFFSLNAGITVNRHMDNFEKNELRKKYNEILEDLLPKFEQELRDAMQEYNAAKAVKENAIEQVNVYTNQAKATAVEVKRGLVEMQLDELFTWKIPYKGRYYFFTFIDNEIRLVRISDMTENEKSELFAQGKINEEYFDGTTATQKGKKK